MMKADSRSFLFLLVALTAVNPLTLNLYVPSIPSVQAEFDALTATVQLTLSLGFVGTGISQLFIGPLSDKYGRRPVLLAGLAIATLASVYCAMTPSLEGLIIGRVIQLSFGAAGLVLGRAIVRDLHEPDKAASMLGYVTMGMAMAPMVAPTIGGILDDLWSWRAGMVFIALATGLVLLVSWFHLPETNSNIGRAKSSREIFSDYGELSRQRNFWAFAAVGACLSGGFFALLGGAPYVSRHLFHMSATEYGLYFMLVPLGYSLGNFLAGRYTARVGLHKMMMTGTLLTLGSTLVLIGFSLFGIEGPISLFGTMFFFGAGNGMAMPTSSAGVVSILPKLAGTASGLAGSLMTFVGAALSYVAAFLLTDSLLPLLLLMCLTAICGVIAVWLTPRQLSSRS